MRGDNPQTMLAGLDEIGDCDLAQQPKKKTSGLSS